MKKTSLSDKLDFYRDDIFAILKVVLFGLLCVFIVVFGKSLINNWLDKDLTQETYGVVTKIEEKKINPKKNYYDGKSNTDGILWNFITTPNTKKLNKKPMFAGLR